MSATSVLGTRTGLPQIWERLSRPYDPPRLIETLLGFPHSVSQQLVGAVLATCDEAEHLLETMPSTLRSLAIATTDRAERCYGEIRGPIMWAETVAARASSAGDRGIFVCAMPDKAFDTDENRVLVSALNAIRLASRSVERMTTSYDDAVLRRARHNGGLAMRFLEHRALSTIPRLQRPPPRAIHRTRSGTRRRTYLPALEMLQRMGEPFTIDSVDVFADERTAAQHDLLAEIVRELESRGRTVKPFRTAEGALTSGTLAYHHPKGRGVRDRLHGVILGEVVIDVPDSIYETDRRRAAHQLEARAQGRQSVAVLEPAHVVEAVDLALATGA